MTGMDCGMMDTSPTGQFAYCLVISPTGHFAYWSFRLRDISPTGQFAYWTVRLLDISPTDCFLFYQQDYQSKIKSDV